MIRRRSGKAGSVAHIAQPFAEHGAHGQIDQRNARYLADVRDRARGARVCLNHIDFSLVNYVLDIDESLHAESKGKFSRKVDELVREALAQVPRRVYGDGIARVNACALDVFHDAGDEYVLPVADGVDFHLGTHQIFVDEDVGVRIGGQNHVHVFADVSVGERNDHVLPAENVAWPHEHGIAELVCRFERLLFRQYGAACRTADAERFKQRIEAAPVLREIDPVRLRAEDWNTRGGERLCQLDGRLSAEGDDNAYGLFQFHNAQCVLRGERVKVETVGGVEIGGDGFRVVVGDGYLISRAFECHHAVDGGIVELDALPDADRARAEDKDHRLAGGAAADKRQRFVLFAGRGVKVRCFRLEFRAAGIDHLARGGQRGGKLLSGKAAYRRVGEAQEFCLAVE